MLPRVSSSSGSISFPPASSIDTASAQSERPAWLPSFWQAFAKVPEQMLVHLDRGIEKASDCVLPYLRSEGHVQHIYRQAEEYRKASTLVAPKTPAAKTKRKGARPAKVNFANCEQAKNTLLSANDYVKSAGWVALQNPKSCKAVQFGQCVQAPQRGSIGAQGPTLLEGEKIRDHKKRAQKFCADLVARNKVASGHSHLTLERMLRQLQAKLLKFLLGKGIAALADLYLPHLLRPENILLYLNRLFVNWILVPLVINLVYKSIGQLAYNLLVELLYSSLA